MFTLENHQSSVKISTKGAQILRWFDVQNQKDILWTLDEKYWKRVAPILFPIVGRLKNDAYRFQGSSFSLGQHGFARECEFDVIESTKSSLVLRLVSNAQTKAVYPFDFELVVVYELEGSSLKAKNRLKNTGEDTLFASFGAHPGFHLIDDISEYSIHIPGATKMERHLIDNGLYTGETMWLHFDQEGFLKLDDSYFEKDAIVFKHEQIRKIDLYHKSNRILGMEIPGEEAPYWGIWKKQGAPFICLEPWWGLADHVNFDGDITSKEGINAVIPNESRSFEYSISI